MQAGRASQFVGAIVAQNRTSSFTSGSTLRNLIVAVTATAGIYGIVTHVDPGELSTAPRRLKVRLVMIGSWGRGWCRRQHTGTFWSIF